MYHAPARREWARAAERTGLITPTLVIIFLGAVVVSFVCSLTEAVLLSTPHSFVESLASHGRRSGRALQELKRRIDRPLIVILTLNTIANMFGSAGVGAESAAIAKRAGLASGPWVAASAAALTVAILVGCEIIPKTLGAIYWKSLAPAIAPGLLLLVRALSPLVWALEVFPRLLARRDAPMEVSRDEVMALTEMGRKTGAIPDRESQTIANLLRLNLMRVRDAMTPRVDVFALPKERTAEDVARSFKPIRYSRIPVYDGSIDEIVGVVHKTRILEACINGQGAMRLEEIGEPLHVVPETKSIASLLDEFTRRHEHMFMVVNEYGGFEGVVTLEDAFEALLGVDIDDEMDRIEKLRTLALERLARQKREPGSAPAAPSSSQHEGHGEHGVR